MAEESSKTFDMSTASKSIEVNPALMADFTSHVIRAKDQAKANKIHNRLKPSAKASNKVNNIWSRSNAKVLKRSAEDEEKERKERERVKIALQQKAEIYNKLHSGEYADKDKLFNVNFEQKRDFSNETVEYTDPMGRTRMVRRSELKDLQERDKETFGEEGSALTEAQQAALSEQNRLRQMHEKWDTQMEETEKKNQVHFADVDYDEAREYGAGNYKFSRNEAERMKQMEDLKATSEETKRIRAEREKSKVKVDEKRLLKVLNKKRLKQKLPILDELPEEFKVDKTDEEKPKEKTMDEMISDNLKALRDAEACQEREKIVREWDIGKEGVTATKATDQDGFKERLNITLQRRVMTQDEWVDEKRNERKNEFAPPTIYDSSKKGGGKRPRMANNKASYNNVPPPSVQSNPSPSTSNNWSQNHPPPRRPNPMPNQRSFEQYDPDEPPPPGMNFNHQEPPVQNMNHPPPRGPRRPNPVPKQRNFGQCDPEEPPPPGLNFNKQEPSNKYEDFDEPPPPGFDEPMPDPSTSSVSLEDRLYLHQQFNAKPIQNELLLPKNLHPDVIDEDFEDEEEDLKRGQGAEIAPPSQMDYFNSNKKAYQKPKGFRSHEQMAESFLAGVQSLKRKHTTDNDDDESD